MSLFAIADTHLSFGSDKPMDSFPGWNDYVSRLQKNWNNVVSDNDTVVIAGDISWAMNFEQLVPDFDFINSLSGKKIILKGNHDYWWSTATKINTFISENNFDTIRILHNNSYNIDGISVCGSRGWIFESDEAHDEKVLSREVARIKASLDSAECEKKIVFLHYPPITANTVCREILDLLVDYGIKKCYFGHLHGVAAKLAVEDNILGIDFRLISSDKLNFLPKLIR